MRGRGMAMVGGGLSRGSFSGLLILKGYFDSFSEVGVFCTLRACGRVYIYSLTRVLATDITAASRRLHFLGGRKVTGSHRSKGMICCSLTGRSVLSTVHIFLGLSRGLSVGS